MGLEKVYSTASPSSKDLANGIVWLWMPTPFSFTVRNTSVVVVAEVAVPN